MSGMGLELDSKLKKMMSSIFLLNKNLDENFWKKNFSKQDGKKWRFFWWNLIENINEYLLYQWQTQTIANSMFSNGKTFTKKYSIFAINVVYIWETLLLDQHVSVAEWSKAPANHSRDQGGVGSIPSPAKNFFFESNFLFSPRVYWSFHWDHMEWGKLHFLEQNGAKYV